MSCLLTVLRKHKVHKHRAAEVLLLPKVLRTVYMPYAQQCYGRGGRHVHRKAWQPARSSGVERERRERGIGVHAQLKFLLLS